MNVDDFINQRIHYLASPTTDLPKPIAVFGVTPNLFESLFSKSERVFSRIKSVLKKNRQKELDSMASRCAEYELRLQEEAGDVLHKYERLLARYGDREGLRQEILEWKNDELSPFRSRLVSYESYLLNERTPLQQRTENFELVAVSVSELRNVRRRMQELQFEYGIETEYQLEYDVPTDVRQEYLDCHTINRKLLFSPYVFIHNFQGFDDESLSLEFLFRNFPGDGKRSLNLYKWGVVCFEPNHKFWAAQTSDEIKELIYTRFDIFDNAATISPFENRLKDELDARNIHYRFQYPFKGYILDFYIEANGKRLNIECDGQEYHSAPNAVEHDRQRNNVMATNGIYVIRFSGSEIWRDAKKCVDLIETAIRSEI